MLYRPAVYRAGHLFDRQRGFTLIELLVVLVIIGILATIAYPAYTKYVERGQRADAQTVMMDIAGRLERCYTNSYSYKPCESAKEKAENSTSELYTDGFSIESENGDYTISAKRKKPESESCDLLELKSSGEQLPEDCW